MSEDVKQGSNSEVAQPTATQEAPQADARQEQSWREVRQKIRALEEQNQKLQSELKPKAEPESPRYGSEDLATIGTVSEMVKAEARKIAEEEIKKLNDSTFMDRARAKFADYDEVMTPESLSLFEQQEPDLAESFLEVSRKDKYKAVVASYKAIKGMGFHTKGSKKAEAKENLEKLKENASKPLSHAAVDNRPVAQARKYMQEDYPSLWKEMNEFARRA